MPNCPSCRRYFAHKDDAINHINETHGEELDGKNMDAAQWLYASTHGGDYHGKCMVCGKPTSWNHKTAKPYRLCDNPKCREKVKDEYYKNLSAKRGITQSELMSDINHQKEMLSSRKIAGTYRFSDGGRVEYVGKLELEFLKFCDLVLELQSKDILPSPEVFYYEDPKDGKKHAYIPDFYLVEYNLLVEIKDGGDHPNMNKKFLEETRYKVALKDTAMQRQTKYNYIRIGGTEFGALVDILYRINHDKKVEKDKKNLVVINEAAVDHESESRQEELNNPQDAGILLFVGKDKETGVPTYLAITNRMKTWYVYDFNLAELYEALGDNPVFGEGGAYEVYRYIGDHELMVNALGEIAATAMAGYTGRNSMYIPDILFSHGVFLDCGGRLKNNEWHKMDFVKVDQGFVPLTKETSSGEEDDE